MSQSTRSGGELLVLATSLGLVALAQIGFLLGTCGVLARGPLLVVAGVLVLGILAMTDVRELGVLFGAWRPGRLGLAVVALIPFFAVTLYPPLAFDETLYHLPFSLAFAESGGLPFLPGLRFPVFPQLAEVLGAMVLLLAGDVATHGVAFLANSLTAAWLFLWASRIYGDAAGLMAAAVWLGNPLVAYVGGTAYVEPLLALFVTAGLYCFDRWRRGAGDDAANAPTERSGGAGGVVDLTLAAVFVAAAAATKYLGLPFVMLLAGVTLLGRGRPWRPSRATDHAAETGEGEARNWLRQLSEMRWRRAIAALRWRDAFFFAVVAAAVAAPWYGRIAAYTGNPVFPYFPGFFGSTAWDPIRFRGIPGPPTNLAELATRAGSYLTTLATLPWDVVMRRERLGGLPPLSPTYLLLVPLALVAAWRDRSIAVWLAVAAGFALLFPFLPPDTRYLLTVLPLVSLAVAAALSGLVRKRSRGSNRVATGAEQRWAGRRTWAVATALLLLPGWLYASYFVWRAGTPPASPAERERFLQRSLPLASALTVLDAVRVPGERVYVLYAEELRYYVGEPVVGDWFGPLRYSEVESLLASPPRLAARLREANVRYLLIDHGRLPPDTTSTPAWSGAFVRLHTDSRGSLWRVAEATPGE